MRPKRPAGRKGARLRSSTKTDGVLCAAARRNTSPSRRYMFPNLASQMRVVFSSMAWNTGPNSPGELEIILSTSAVAVCCCSDSRSSLSNRVFSMAMTAWSAKVVASSISLSEKSSTLARRSTIAPNGVPSRNSGMARIVRWPNSRAMALPSGYAPVSACRSATWTARCSRIQRPLTVPRTAGVT
jgi:hypothetical protein